MAINRGVLARNILRAGVLDRLLQSDNLTVVVIINTKIHDYFRKEFTHPNIILEEVPAKKNSRFRKFFIFFFNGLVYRETEHRKLKFGNGQKPPPPKWVFWLKHTTFSIVSRIRALKHFARWAEAHVFIEREYDYLFRKYRPDAVFCASIYSRGLDFVLIKAAKRFCVPSVSMPKSWDTVGRLFFAAPSDIFILNNEHMKKSLVTDQMIPSENLYIGGFPQFDIYAKKKEYMTKEMFCAITGLSHTKPIVLYASEGEWTHWDYLHLDELIEKHRILERYNLILRPHFSDMHLKRYGRFEKHDGVYIDDKHIRISYKFNDKWDPTIENMEWLAQVISVSDVVITFVSTFALDAMVFDKPVINIYYDIQTTRKMRVPMVPVKGFYDCVHYNAILEEHPVALAESGNEVMEWIDRYVKNPHIHSAERRKTVEKLCYKIDGKSSERIADVILKLLGMPSV